MTNGFIITGTDTGIGKTVFSAMLTLALNGTYWKPLQSGVDDGTDTGRVRQMTGLPEQHFIPEAHVFREPLSPHRASELEAISIDVRKLVPPTPAIKPLIIEGAGGLLVPVTRDVLQIDIFKNWQMPVILCARTGLGTINHTLLSIEALKKRQMRIHGIAFIGNDNHDNIRTISSFSGIRSLGRLPLLDKADKASLQQAFTDHFRKEDFDVAYLASLHAARAR